jgi:chromosomal replication initiator protein
MEAEWLEALPRLRERVGERNFATWIAPIRCRRRDDALQLEVANRFFQEWVTRHFLLCIRETLAEGRSAAVDVRVVVAAADAAPAQVASAPRPIASEPRVPRDAGGRMPKIGRLVPEYTFETFVVGDANQVACEAARAVASLPGRRYNPFFLWGGVGLGKTHLVNALAHDLLSRPPRRRMACLSAESFMNTLIASLRQDHMSAFRDRFRDVDVLILDDVQFIAGKERTQEEFFHTFNALYASGKQIVLTSDKPPHAIAALEQRLRSRFEGGLMADIFPPTPDMRVAIVTKKAAAQGVQLPIEIACMVAQRSGPSVRELEGALTRVLATSMLQSVQLSADLVQRVLAPVVPPQQVVSVEAVQEMVGRHFNLSVADLKSHRRDRAVSFPRQVAMYLSRTVAAASFPSIAEKFGGRDHSTVMYAVRIVEERRAQNVETGSMLVTLEQELRTRPQ